MNRRLALSLIAGAVVVPGAAPALAARPPEVRRIRLVNPHTGETFSGTYRDDRGPLGAAMADLSTFLRDFRQGATIKIDVAVIDFLAAVMATVGAQTAVVLSAYRTPETNATLASTRFGIAENSQHLYGRALDVDLGSRLADAMRAARAMRRGGVGWYPHSGFMHLDSGPVRNWDLDDSGLLFEGRPLRASRDGVAAVGPRSGRFLPELERSGRPLPVLQRSGHPVLEMERRDRILSELARSRR